MTTINKICTSLEQSKKLIELGIDRKTADMFWVNGVPGIFPPRLLPCHKRGMTDGTPAWSVSALLNLMPETIVPDNGSHQVYQMDVYNYDGWRICEYVGEIDRDSLVGFEKDYFIDAAYEMIVWLKENGKI